MQNSNRITDRLFYTQQRDMLKSEDLPDKLTIVPSALNRLKIWKRLMYLNHYTFLPRPQEEKKVILLSLKKSEKCIRPERIRKFTFIAPIPSAPRFRNVL